jgi:hypothetical protein
MFSVEGKEVKLDDLPDRKSDQAGPSETLRVYQFTIDCDYNKPRAEGEGTEEKKEEAKQGK